MVDTQIQNGDVTGAAQTARSLPPRIAALQTIFILARSGNIDGAEKTAGVAGAKIPTADYRGIAYNAAMGGHLDQLLPWSKKFDDHDIRFNIFAGAIEGIFAKAAISEGIDIDPDIPYYWER